MSSAQPAATDLGPQRSRRTESARRRITDSPLPLPMPRPEGIATSAHQILAEDETCRKDFQPMLSELTRLCLDALTKLNGHDPAFRSGIS